MLHHTVEQDEKTQPELVGTGILHQGKHGRGKGSKPRNHYFLLRMGLYHALPEVGNEDNKRDVDSGDDMLFGRVPRGLDDFRI